METLIRKMSLEESFTDIMYLNENKADLIEKWIKEKATISDIEKFQEAINEAKFKLSHRKSITSDLVQQWILSSPSNDKVGSTELKSHN